MNWLTASLAFATAMLFYAVVVSTLVEMIHRFVGLREKGLELMLGSLFEKVVKPHVSAAAAIDGKSFAAAIMANRAVGDKKSGWFNGVIEWMLSRSQMTSIPVEVFTQKLADSKILGAANASLDAIVQDISQKYVAYGAEASEYFRRRARLLSVIVAFPVAFCFYVHPYDLARIFISDPQLAQKVADYQIKLAYDIPDTAAPGVTNAGGAAQPPATLTDDERVAQLETELKDLRQSITEWDDLGVPVGWPDTSALPTCETSGGSWWSGGCKSPLPVLGAVVTRPSPLQIFWLIVGSLLVGLGAPFWAQAVGALTVSRTASQKIASIVEGDDTIGAGAPAAGSAGSAGSGGKIAAPLPKREPTPVKTFQIAYQAETLRSLRHARAAKPVLPPAVKAAAAPAAGPSKAKTGRGKPSGTP